MRSIIQQSVFLPATPEELFKTYMSPAQHAAFTGAKVVISGKKGSRFRAFGGMITGTMLATARPRLIIQSWRSVHFKDGDPDSTLILTFTAEGNSSWIDLIHLDVPSQDYDGVREGWEKYYWTPWRRYLESRKQRTFGTKRRAL